MSLWSPCTTAAEGDSGHILCTHMGSCPQHPFAPRGCRRVAGQGRLLRVVPPGSVGLCLVLDTEGLIAGTLSDAALSPVPSPHTHLSAPRSSPASKE